MRVRSSSATGVHLLTSRFEDYSRCDRPWAERSDGMTSAMIRPACRTSIALLKPIARSLPVFAPVGRMALTNYLMHSIICVVLSYGFGLALWWRIGASTAMAIAAAIIVLQIPLSAWWLSRYRFGPIEWIWRRLTYGRPLALRASS
jgi:uncharacterized membrane protein YeiB